MQQRHNLSPNSMAGYHLSLRKRNPTGEDCPALNRHESEQSPLSGPLKLWAAINVLIGERGLFRELLVGSSELELTPCLLLGCSTSAGLIVGSVGLFMRKPWSRIIIFLCAISWAGDKLFTREWCKELKGISDGAFWAMFILFSCWYVIPLKSERLVSYLTR